MASEVTDVCFCCCMVCYGDRATLTADDATDEADDRQVSVLCSSCHCHTGCVSLTSASTRPVRAPGL